MNKKKIISLLVGSVLTLAVIAGAFSYRTVFAQTGTTTTDTTATQTAPALKKGMRGGGYSENDLASALGITLEKLQAAEKSATAEALKQAVSAGLITQTQADQYAQESTNGIPFDAMRWLKDSTIDYNTLLADALGISTDDLAAAKVKAYNASIDAAVTAGSMTQDQADAAKARYAISNSAKVQSAMKTAYEAAINQAVSDGLITQAQADLLLAESANHTGMFGFDMGFGGRGGGHGGRGGHGDFNRAGNTDQAPSTVDPTVTP
jgi:hypothetical protein